MKTASYRKFFITAIQKHFPGTSDYLITQTDNHFMNIAKDIAFIETSGNPIDKRLDFSAYFLALIKTLDGQGESFERIRNVCLEIVWQYVKPKNKFQRFLKRLPPKLSNTWVANYFLKGFSRRVEKGTGGEGFVATIITSKEETYGFGYGIDILECGICKLFKKNGYEKYASILCEVDEVTSGLAGLQLVRTGTIAWGAKKCDFRYKKL